ncbi:MAG: heavy-metal-associated domain-containing protein [Planctomycetes bacterium]|nr:heavy-metal-associated domain-containing protein [Planctomycetota bacterium]
MRYLALFLVALLAAACGQNTAGNASNTVMPDLRKDKPSPTDVELVPGKNVESPLQATGVQLVTLEIEGMHCDGCVATVKGILEKLPGVDKCDVTLATHSAVVRMKSGAKFPEADAKDQLSVDNFTLKKAVPTPTN